VSRIKDLQYLHPTVKNRIVELEKRIQDKELPLIRLETYRTPYRQFVLWQYGRTISHTRIRTRTLISAHALLCAVDYAIYRDGNFDWRDNDENIAVYKQLLEEARECGLKTGAAWKNEDWGHVYTYGGLSWNDLKQGEVFEPGKLTKDLLTLFLNSLKIAKRIEKVVKSANSAEEIIKLSL